VLCSQALTLAARERLRGQVGGMLPGTPASPTEHGIDVPLEDEPKRFSLVSAQ
jgi:hypothetical protein